MRLLAGNGASVHPSPIRDPLRLRHAVSPSYALLHPARGSPGASPVPPRRPLAPRSRGCLPCLAPAPSHRRLREWRQRRWGRSDLAETEGAQGKQSQPEQEAEALPEIALGQPVLYVCFLPTPLRTDYCGRFRRCRCRYRYRRPGDTGDFCAANSLLPILSLILMDCADCDPSCNRPR